MSRQNVRESIRRPEIDLALVRANAASAATAAEQTTFVVDPLAAVGKNVYNTLAQAAAAAAGVNGPKTVLFRAAMTHPAGVYDFSGPGGDWNTNFVTQDGLTLAQQFLAGSTLIGVSDFACPMNYLGGVGTVLITAPATPAGSSIFRVRGAFGIAATGGGDFFQAANVAGQSCTWFLEEGAGFYAANQATLCARGVNASISLIPLDVGFVASNTLVESAGGQIFVAPDSPGATVNRTQPNLATTGPNLVFGVNFSSAMTLTNVKGPGNAMPAIQAGTIQLATGTTGLIPATITANSRITCTVRTMTPGAGNLTVQYAALTGDRVVGLVGAGGGFKLTALIAAGTININDTSFLDWHIDN